MNPHLSTAESASSQQPELGTCVYRPFDLELALKKEAVTEQSPWTLKRNLRLSSRPSPSLLDANAQRELELIRGLRQSAGTDPKRADLWRAAAWITSEEERCKFVQLVEGDAEAARCWWMKLGPHERQRRRQGAKDAHQRRRRLALSEQEWQRRKPKLPAWRQAHELLRDIMSDAVTEADAARFVISELHLLLGSLIRSAQAGDATAVEALARVALRATGAIDDLTLQAQQQRSELIGTLRTVARTNGSWPCAVSATDGEDDVKRRRETLDKLEVGRDTLLALDFTRRAKPEDALGRVAVKLLEHIQDTGAAYRAMHNGCGALIERDAGLPGWAADAAKLETFTKDNADAWWQLAKPIFKKACPDPGVYEQLKSRIPVTKRITLGRRFNVIEGALQKRFQSLAPKAR
jgi:hypothetical protein